MLDAVTATTTTFRILDPGRQRQTALMLNRAVHSRLEELSASLPARSGNKLVVATLAASMPEDVNGALRLMATHHGDRRAGPALEKNVRLPDALRARLFDLADQARERAPFASRSLLASAVLAAGLPEDADGARELLADYDTALAWSNVQW